MDECGYGETLVRNQTHREKGGRECELRVSVRTLFRKCVKTAEVCETAVNVDSCASVWRHSAFAHKLVEGLIVYRDVQSGSWPWPPSSQAVSDRIEESLSLSYPPVPSAQKF